MENASKALIIAGAILLSILIISLGIFIFQQAKNAVNTEQLSELEVTSFNGKFDKYLGTKVQGSQVKALIQAVTTNNNTAGAEDDSKKIVINKKASEINAGKSYSVTVPDSDGYTSGGLIHKIVIEDATK